MNQTRRQTTRFVRRSAAGYPVIYEKGPTSWAAFVPSLPVVVAVSDSRTQVEQDIEKAIAMHLRGLHEDGEPIPRPPILFRGLRRVGRVKKREAERVESQ